MNNSLTPTFTRRRSKFVTPASASSFKSPLLNKAVKKVKFDPAKASIEELRQSTLELWQKNLEFRKDIYSLTNEGYKEDQLKWYIDKLHEYNDIKDIAQIAMGKIAVNKKTTVRKIHEEFGMTDSD